MQNILKLLNLMVRKRIRTIFFSLIYLKYLTLDISKSRRQELLKKTILKFFYQLKN